MLRSSPAPLHGIVVSTVDLVFAEICASEFDLVWVDLEHSALSLRDAQALVIAAQGRGAFSMVRLPGPHPDGVGAVLDLGADGVVVPRAETSCVVEELGSQLQFPPEGERGYAPRRAVFRGGSAAEYHRPACVVQIESRAGVEAAPEIARVEACDALVVGANDLALDLNIARRPDHPRLLEALAAVRSAATAAGKGWGLAAGGDPSTLARLADNGAMLIYSSDVAIFAEAVRERSQGLSEDA